MPYVGRGGAQSIFTRLPHCSDVDVDANVSVSVAVSVDASLPWQLRAMTVSLSLLLYVSVVVSALVVVCVVVVVIVVKSRPATPVCVLGWQPLPALLSPCPCLLLSFLPCCDASYRKFTCAFMCARFTCFFFCYCICCLPAASLCTQLVRVELRPATTPVFTSLRVCLCMCVLLLLPAFLLADYSYNILHTVASYNLKLYDRINCCAVACVCMYVCVSVYSLR